MVLSQLFSFGGHVGRLKPGSKPGYLYVSFSSILLSLQENYVNSEIIGHYSVTFVCLHFFLNGYQNAQFIQELCINSFPGVRNLVGERIYCHP